MYKAGISASLLYQDRGDVNLRKQYLTYTSLPQTNVKTYVAAKDIYFGVGGSITEFEAYLDDKINSEHLPIHSERFKVNSGLKRSIICIETNKAS
ncbi:CIC_collapsed_G0026970.mRNA.1.CDS.1 [Saccharomyces cerevisiae]|nr:CIC_collapsed_G0026970.mRNA.1.CDS.1 [Saccharomyces cerevisiae]